MHEHYPGRHCIVAGPQLPAQRPPPDIAFVNGSVGLLTTANIFTSSCLAAGEAGYFTLLDTDSNAYSNVNKVEFTVQSGGRCSLD